MPAPQAEDEHSKHSRVDDRENDRDSSETEPESEDVDAHREWEKRNQRGGDRDLVDNRRDSSEKNHNRVGWEDSRREKNHNREGDHLRGKENNQPIAWEHGHHRGIDVRRQGTSFWGSEVWF